MIPALIAAAAAITVALIGRSTKKAAKSTLESADLVLGVMSDVREDVRDLRGLLWQHVTDRSAHFYVAPQQPAAPVSTPKVPEALRNDPRGQSAQVHFKATAD